MRELGAKPGNIPDPNLFPAVSAALEGMGIDIYEGATSSKIDQLTDSLFAIAGQAQKAEPVFDSIIEFIRKPEEE